MFRFRASLQPILKPENKYAGIRLSYLVAVKKLEQVELDHIIRALNDIW